MAATKPVIHRRDHEHGGADPVRILWDSTGGSGGGGTDQPSELVQFATKNSWTNVATVAETTLWSVTIPPLAATSSTTPGGFARMVLYGRWYNAGGALPSPRFRAYWTTSSHLIFDTGAFGTIPPESNTHSWRLELEFTGAYSTEAPGGIGTLAYFRYSATAPNATSAAAGHVTVGTGMWTTTVGRVTADASNNSLGWDPRASNPVYVTVALPGTTSVTFDCDAGYGYTAAFST